MGGKNKKGLSTVLATVIVLGITVAMGALVWAVVTNLVKGQLDESESCFGVLDQVKLNNDYTCYNSTSDKVQFSISVGDISVDKILISVTFSGASQSAELTNESQALTNIKNYPSRTSGVKMPGKNSGSTYFFEGITDDPTSLTLIPIIKGNQCGVADTIHRLDSCLSLVS